MSNSLVQPAWEAAVATHDQPLLSPLGDSAIVVTFGDDISVDTHSKVRAFSESLDSSPPDAMIEYIPAFTTVTVIYDSVTQTCEQFSVAIRSVLADLPQALERTDAKLVEVPVCYGGDFGPDLEFVASHSQVEPREVVRLHCEPEYVVYMIGFAPGFPYLGGMSERIATPRRDSPRQSIPAGSVGIAGQQTGVYPIETPGGWQLIGRTPLALFRPDSTEPSLLEAGDRLRFKPISREAYDELVGEGVRA